MAISVNWLKKVLIKDALANTATEESIAQLTTKSKISKCY